MNEAESNEAQQQSLFRYAAITTGNQRESKPQNADQG